VLLAGVYGERGQREEGLSVLAEAVAVVDRTGERFYEAELYRLKGELTLQGSRVQRLASSVQKEAEACFLKAIEIAQRQQAKSLELRATMSLARLWQQQGKKAEAHQLLSDIYNWFTEGFDTKDLQGNCTPGDPRYRATRGGEVSGKREGAGALQIAAAHAAVK
jgi:predicted ATPase